MTPSKVWLATLLTATTIASPTPTHPELSLITPPPTRTHPEHVFYQRGVISSLTAEVASYGASLLSDLGSGIPSYVTNGILPGEIGLPTGSAAMSSANVSSSDIAAEPTQVLNIPGYGNWTGSAWNLFIHGNVFKQPNLTNETVDNLANKFLIGTSVAQLDPQGQDEARNVTKAIFVEQQGDVNVTMNILPGSSFGGDGENNGGGGVEASINQTLQLPYPTTPEGDFAVFIPLDNSSGINPGTGNIAPQKVNVYAQGTDTGNATSYLVSDEGMTVISDIDDILRITQIYQPKEGLINSFAKPYVQWMNMPDIYRNWSQSIPTMHFHYLTTTPEQITRNYMDFIYKTYPGGSFDDRPLNFSDLTATLSIRKFLLDRVFQTFPQRKFILVADTSNSDVMRDYPALAKEYPGQVQCIFLRNTSATDPSDHFPYNTAGFEGLNQQMYMFFLVPDDLTNLDISNGQCYNASVPQNVTFSYQGLPLGLSKTSGKNNTASTLIRGMSGWSSPLAIPMIVACALFFAAL